jgi:hypothetical protein
VNVIRTRILSILVACVAASPSFATLGEPATSVENDRVKIMATLQRAAALLYTVHSMSTAQGVHVREYVSRSGVVFAVCWDGPFLPDLRQLLGVHFVTFKSEVARTPRAGHSQVYIVRPEVVIQSTGHMRSFRGSAVIPASVPAGLTPAEIR